MKHQFLIILILVASLTGAASPVAAQESTAVPSTPANETTNNTTTSPATPPGFDGEINLNPDRTTYAGKIDVLTKLVDWDYDGERFVLLVESKAPNRITLTEGVKVQRGMGTYATKTVNVPKGRTRITFRADSFDGAAVVFFATSQCRRAQSCSYLSTGQRRSDSVSPLERTTSTAGWLGGAGVAVAMAGAAAYQRRNKEWPEVEELE